MERKNIIGVLLVTIIALVIALSIPGREHNTRSDLPWQITPTATGLVKVFGLTIGESTLKQVETKFEEPAKVSLFERGEDKQRVVEAYFDRILLSGLRAQVVVVIDVSDQLLEDIYQHGTRIAKMGDGGRKVTLSSDDIERIYKMPIRSMTYIPRARLDGPLLTKRFGEPQRKIAETEAGITHWLYPEKGLDILLNNNGKVVFQYLPPNNFDEIVEPLERLTHTKS